jgi:hypothetical protein
MTFEELLDQAMAMLERRGRVTYRALKRQFNLDDAYLDDLKAELIEAQRVAIDEGGTVLVWTGNPATMAVPPGDPARVPLSYTPPYLAEKILPFVETALPFLTPPHVRTAWRGWGC